MRLANGLFAVLITSASGCAAAAEIEPVVHADRAILVIEGWIVAMQGGCNALECPDIQYKVATSNIIKNKISANPSASALAVLRVCGESGLKLGVHYRFSLLGALNQFDDELTKPISEGGQLLQCDFVLTDEPVEQVRVSPRLPSIQ